MYILDMARKKKEFQKEKQIFLEHIQKRGLRRTAQRDLILDIFLKTEEHLSSEDLYWLIQKEDASIGHTTVYRTLKLLTDAGLAREVRFGDGKTYYEHHYDHEHHDHIICTECGKVVEFFSAEIETLQDEMAAKFGFKLTHHSLRILGLCEECQKKDSETAASGAQPRIRVKSVVGQL
ncbi:MAG: Fur family transcriptional regulator [Acidobacteriota bacterium]